MDKNQAMIDFLCTCPIIASNPLFFNFVDAKDKSKQINTVATDNAINSKFIDGSVLRRYTIMLNDFCSVSYLPIPKNLPESTEPQLLSENVEDIALVQEVLDWVNEQNDLQNYPDFGEDCQIDEMKTTTDIPNLTGVNTQVTPSLAKYGIGIQIDYLDKSKMLWK